MHTFLLSLVLFSDLAKGLIMYRKHLKLMVLSDKGEIYVRMSNTGLPKLHFTLGELKSQRTRGLKCHKMEHRDFEISVLTVERL